MKETMMKLYLMSALAICVGVLGAGCAEFEQESCVTNADCRGVLGLGSVCLDNGFCSAAGIVDKQGEDVPVSCQGGEVFPAAAEQRPEDFGEAAVIGVIARSGTDGPVDGVELAIREFAIAADESELDVVAVTCVVDESAPEPDVERELQAAALYLANDINANVLMVSGLRDDLQTVLEAGSVFDVRDESESPAIFTFASLDTSQGGGILFSTVPTRDIEDLALTDRVRQAVGDPTGKKVRVVVFQNKQVISPADSAALAPVLQAAFAGTDVGISLEAFTVVCQGTGTGDALSSQLMAEVSGAEEGEELHLVFVPGCDNAASTVGSLLNTIAESSEFDEFTDTVKSITLTAEAFSKENYVAFSGLKSLEGILRGISPAGNPGSAEYQAFRNSYQSVFSSQEGLGSSPLVAHAADATWLSILGYFAAYTNNGRKTSGLTGAAVRSGIRQFICSAEECPDVLSFPRTVAAFEGLVEDLNRDLDATFRVMGASGPLRFAAGRTPTVVEEAYFTQWKISDPQTCLAPFGGDPSISNPQGFICSFLSSMPEDYVLYPKDQ